MLGAVRQKFTTVAATMPRAYWFVWWGTLINRLGGMVVPLLMIYLTTGRHMSVKGAGAILSGFGAGQVVASIVGGQMTDRLGRRITMLVSLFGGAIVMMVLATLREVTPIAIAVGCLGFVGELYRPAVAAYVSDVVPVEDQRRAYGLLYWAVNLGFAVATALGGLLATIDFKLLFFADAATMALYGVIVVIAVRETRPAGPRVTAATSSSISWWRDRTFCIFVGLNFLLVLMPMQTITVLSAQISAQGFAPLVYGIVMGFAGLLVITFQPFVITWIANRDGDRILVVSALLYGLGMFAHGLATNVIAHCAAAAIWTFAELLEAPTRSSMVAAMAPVQARGRYQGAIVMTWGAAALVAPRIGTQIWEDVSPLALWSGCLGLGVFVAVGFAFTAPARRARIASSSGTGPPAW